MTGFGAKEEDVALERGEKKDKRNKKTENGLGPKSAHSEKTITTEREDNGVMLKTSRKKIKKMVEKDNTNRRSLKEDGDNEGLKEGISVVSGHEQRKRKKEKKERKFKHAEEEKDEKSKGSEYCEIECLSNTKEQEESDKRKKKEEKKKRKLKDKEMEEDKVSKKSKHRERDDIDDNKLGKSDKQKKGTDVVNQDFSTQMGNFHVDSEENIDYGKCGRSKRKKKKIGNEGESRKSTIKESVDPKEVQDNDGHFSSSKKKRDKEEDVEMEVRHKKKKKKLVEDFGFEEPKTGITESMTDHIKDSEPKQSSKRVTFSGNVEVFPPYDVRDPTEENEENNLVIGERFTQKEDKIIKDAVLKYIEERGLGENGMTMIRECRKHPETRNCWREIAAALPWRPFTSVYRRGKILLQRGKVRGFTDEDKELIKKFVKERGPKWTELANIMGRYSDHVKCAWNRMQCTKTGAWSQEELQTLFDLVNMDLQMKGFEVKKSYSRNSRNARKLRDNISWTAISEKLGTRSYHECCRKWYSQLASPMIQTGEWSETDDYKLVNELHMLDACCVEDVDWDNLLENRSGAVCRQRWRQMVNHIGSNGLLSFPEQVEVLAKRYRPDILKTRETLDSVRVEM